MPINFRDKKVGIIAPASGSSTEVEKLNKFKSLLKQANINYVINDDIFTATAIPFYSNTKQYRIDNFKKFLTDPDIYIIWCVRGGYGSLEVAIESLAAKPVLPKIIIGFSDITAMHALFNQIYNLPTIHGNVITTVSDVADLNQILDVLNGKTQKLGLTAINTTGKEGTISGKLSGGNLTVYTTLLGTKLHPKPDGHILLLEDVSEKGYAIKRNLCHLQYSGIFESCKAIIFGEFTGGDEYVDYAINEFCRNDVPKIPTYRVSHVGHVSPNNPLVFGNNGTIIDNNLSFTFDNSQ